MRHRGAAAALASAVGMAGACALSFPDYSGGLGGSGGADGGPTTVTGASSTGGTSSSSSRGSSSTSNSASTSSTSTTSSSASSSSSSSSSGAPCADAGADCAKCVSCMEMGVCKADYTACNGMYTCSGFLDCEVNVCPQDSTFASCAAGDAGECMSAPDTDPGYITLKNCVCSGCAVPCAELCK